MKTRKLLTLSMILCFASIGCTGNLAGIREVYRPVPAHEIDLDNLYEKDRSGDGPVDVHATSPQDTPVILAKAS